MKPSKKNGVNYVSATEQRHIYLDILYHYKLSFPETNASAYSTLLALALLRTLDWPETLLSTCQLQSTFYCFVHKPC